MLPDHELIPLAMILKEIQPSKREWAARLLGARESQHNYCMEKYTGKSIPCLDLDMNQGYGWHANSKLDPNGKLYYWSVLLDGDRARATWVRLRSDHED